MANTRRHRLPENMRKLKPRPVQPVHRGRHLKAIEKLRELTSSHGICRRYPCSTSAEEPEGLRAISGSNARSSARANPPRVSSTTPLSELRTRARKGARNLLVARLASPSDSVPHRGALGGRPAYR
jgi:hypothetical protein